MILDVILRVAAKLFIPFILMFGLYVHLHGDFGPGGGFQAGVIIAAAVILYAIVFGKDAAVRAVPPWAVEAMMPLGVLIFAAVGVWSMVMGGEYLNYSILLHNPPSSQYEAQHGQHWGVFLVEIGVLVTVTGTMLGIFYFFAGRGRVDPAGAVGRKEPGQPNAVRDDIARENAAQENTAQENIRQQNAAQGGDDA